MPSLARKTQSASQSAACVPQGKAGKQVGDSPPLVSTEVKSHLCNSAASSEPNVLWQLQRVMWKITQDSTLAGCHRWLAPYAGVAQVEFTGKGNNARFGNLQNSHSVWSSPLSSAQICNLRGKQLGEGLDRWVKQDGHSVMFLTLTLRHSKEDSLQEMWDLISKCWRSVTAGKAWRDPNSGDKAKFGIAHTVRAVEVTHGKNGWHVHTHAALLLDSPLSPDEISVLEGRIFSRWARSAERLGKVAPTKKSGIDLQAVANESGEKAVGKYLVKGVLSGLGQELTGLQAKQARGKNRTPFQLLRDVAIAFKEEGKADPRDVAIWHEWEKGSKGRRQLLWSKGCKEALKISDLDDEELVDQALEEEPREVVLQVPHDQWKKIQSKVETRQQVLDACSRGRDAREAQKLASDVLLNCEIDHILVISKVDCHQPSGDGVPKVTQGSKDLLKGQKELKSFRENLPKLTLF